MYRSVVITLMVVLITACASKKALYNRLDVSAQAYFKVFAKRQNMPALLAFYADDAVLQDMVYGHQALGRQGIAEFYAWDDAPILVDGPSLEVFEQTVDETRVVTRGIFKRFHYQGKTLGPWRFVIWQTFNKQGLIVRQYDWINYTPKTEYSQGNNLNEVIPPDPNSAS